ncbi:hypothetical protein B0T26DRAFT_385246 [Lasiosphaeria miniovina]|uniref:Uncharacterized protein n=1 Tax=Lasiosphaeria miniovina TaxID=1954250 RepID=A0AA40AEC7_9PEZI|nr:uncharacterized protein B0T26DRAFT_385246 [Lasiosphaeria miniovina]KAK0714118.1 hypothetical protein B0T26DRAFT_385246 [Lasiosphaeria miniovina]
MCTFLEHGALNIAGSALVSSHLAVKDIILSKHCQFERVRKWVSSYNLVGSEPRAGTEADFRQSRAVRVWVGWLLVMWILNIVSHFRSESTLRPGLLAALIPPR